MSLQPDRSDDAPLFPRANPPLSIDALLAIDLVSLAAADVPRGLLRDFYSGLLGLLQTGNPDDGPDLLRFSHHRRSILLDRNRPDPGHLALLLTSTHFSDALLRLRDRRIPFELLHADAGLSRAMYLRDPAGNWIHLLETRPF
jgi:catechol-2,3-dioxygenase